MILAVFLGVGAIPAVAACVVQSVHDGDTLTARCDGQVIKVRLAEIDAPERSQPYSRQSTENLKNLCVGQPLELGNPRPDKYGRSVARVHCAGVDANAEQVRRGYAWAFDKYLTDPLIKRLEAEARAARRGLWAGSDPFAPWDFRHPPVR